MTADRGIGRRTAWSRGRGPACGHSRRHPAGAQRRITLSLFRCNDDEIFAELAARDRTRRRRRRAARRRAPKGGTQEAAEALEHSRGDRRHRARVHRSRRQYHAKYLIADDGPAVVASLNFTRSASDAPAMRSSSPTIRRRRRACARLMAADPRGRPMPDDLSERLIIGPERARRQFTALIERARSSIRLIDAKLSDPDLVSLLNARRAAGLTVEVFDAKQLGESEVARQDHADRRQHRRRRQPGAGRPEPRFSSRGRDLVEDPSPSPT